VTETGLGPFPAVALSDAKAKVDGLRKQIANGICPITAKKAARLEQTTFKEAAEGWIATHKSSWKGGDKGSQMRNVNVLLHHHGKALADMPVSELTPDRVQAALEKLWSHTPLQGRRTLAAWERVMDYAKAKGMRSGDNPCAWRGMHEYRFPKVRGMDRGHFHALRYEMMPEFMEALRKRQARSIGAIALEWTILTACRSGETLGMQWSEIDLDKQTWTIPAQRMKGGREHVIPLCDRAMEILNLQKQYSSGSRYVFTGTNQTRMADVSMRSVLSCVKVKTSVHGFRSTFRDWAGDLTHFQREHVEACLAHQVGSDVERAYRRQTALQKRREILTAWCDYCGGELQP
jgi:integrase